MALKIHKPFAKKSKPPATNFAAYLAELAVSPADTETVAFFDLDRTLISGYSVTAFALERLRSRSLSMRRMLSQAGSFVGYGLGRSDVHELLLTTVRDLAGVSEREMTELGERAFRRRVQGWIYREARTLIEMHRRKRHPIVMVTSATRFQAVPIARDLGVDQIFCTELEIRDGRITGEATPCFGAGKRIAAERFVGDCGGDMTQAFFYSDSSDDLPLLEAVGRPVAANAKAALARLAADRGWPSLVFDQPGDNGRAAA
jgi:putative phosphoserine phosphatase/1-acylglycerol-3-phosphate O-acyltransferase